MGKGTNYVSKEADSDGFIHWTDEENAVWHDLITRQMKCIKGKACDEYFDGLELLNLPMDLVPQLSEIDEVLIKTTGWQTHGVPALIPFQDFFELLANKKFPVATFIRSREEFDYLQEPDIFHEIFGHCVMLTNPDFAAFTHSFGKLGLQAREEDWTWMMRLYWFTVEFGLIEGPKGRQIYGGGILSSPGETEYAFNSNEAEREKFDALNVLRTPYRIDIMQPIYFTIEGLSDLYDIANLDILGLTRKAQEMGSFDPKYPPIEDDPQAAAAE